MSMAQPGEFCLVSHDPAFISNLFLCCLKGQKRREACDSPFFRISLFLLRGCYNKGMAQLGEFCLVSHDLVFVYNLFTCRLKGLMRREAHASPSFCISLFLLRGCYNKGMAQLGGFCLVAHDLVFVYNLFACRFKDLMRPEACTSLFFHIPCFC
jgi:hypothetical protein